MPFPDELTGAVVVVDHDDRWPDEFAALAGQLGSVLGATARRIDHIGSTYDRCGAIGGTDRMDCTADRMTSGSRFFGGCSGRDAGAKGDCCVTAGIAHSARGAVLSSLPLRHGPPS